MWVFIPLVGFVVGAAVGRWWAVAAAVPFGAYIVETSPLQGRLGVWVAFVLSALVACAIAAGVALRRLQKRSRGLRT